MISGAKWMLMWRSGPCSSEAMGLAWHGRATDRRVRRPSAAALRRRRPALQEAPGPPRAAGARRGARGRGRGAAPARTGLRVAVGRDGQEFASEELARWLEDRRMSGRDLCFVIGGPAGLELPCDHRLSFGRATLPHQLAQVVLLEQIFRARKILANEPYHLSGCRPPLRSPRR